MPTPFRLPWIPIAVVGLYLAFGSALRAQATETPQTIGPGNLLLRMDAISVGIRPDTLAPNQYKAVALGTALLSAGLASDLDLQVGAQLFLHDTFSRGGIDRSQSGLGELTLRPKWTFWSDPANGEALALIPYVMIPTDAKVNGTNHVEGGVIFPWSTDLGPELKAAAMVEWDEFRNLADTRYDTRWYAGGFLKWKLGTALSAYGEMTVSDSTAGGSTAVGTLGAGATFAVSRLFEWDLQASRVLGSGRSAWTESLRFRWKIF